MPKFKKEYYCKSELKELGFTDKSISDFLGLHDKEADNPYYKKYPLKLFLKKRVDKVLKTKKFLLTKTSARKIGAQKASKTKRDKTLKLVDSFSVRVRKVKNVVARAIKSYNDFNLLNDRFCCNVSECSEKRFLDRIVVNYIRHELTEYDNQLFEIFGKTGKNEAYITINERIYSKISKIYPEYAEECRNQLNKKINSQQWRNLK